MHSTMHYTNGPLYQLRLHIFFIFTIPYLAYIDDRLDIDVIHTETVNRYHTDYAIRIC